MKQMEPHVAMIPSPGGMGHLIPFAELAKLLVSRFHISVSLLIPATTHQPTSAQSSFLDSIISNGISYSYLPPVDPNHLPESVSIDVTISLLMLHSLPSIQSALGLLAKRAHVVALVTDLFGTSLFDMARGLSIPPYMYFTNTAMYVLFCFHLPKLDETVSCEYSDMPGPIFLPGCVPINAKDLEDAVQDRKAEAYRWMLHHVKRYGLAEGILINSFFDLEPGATQALQIEVPHTPPIYPIGPIVRPNSGNNSFGSECLTWLDKQPSGSVLYISFGSGGTLSNEQLIELAIGLEMSGQRFLWVVRSPNNDSSFGSLFTAESVEDPFSFLPEGYIERTKDRGLLIPSWAPQVEILGHGSIGGFLTHCGWNSALESIVHGVPLIAWPLYAEQKMNAVMLEEGAKVALRPKSNLNDLVEADEVSKVVKELMEGEEGKRITNRVKELSMNANNAISENGVSTKSLEKVVLKWRMSKLRHRM